MDNNEVTEVMNRFRNRYKHVSDEAIYDILMTGFRLGVKSSEDIVKRAIEMKTNQTIFIDNNDGVLIV